MDKSELRAIDCNNLQLSLGALFRRDPDGGVLKYFRPERICFSANTRAGIRQACDLLGLGAGCEVLAPAYNCGSEIDPILASGAAVKFYRTDETAQTDLQDIEARITPATRAIYVIHYFGFPQSEMARLHDLCKDHGLFLIEDCALALFSGETGAGRFGDIALYCFYKFFPVVGGGALVINNAQLPTPPAFKRPAPARFVLQPLLGRLASSVLSPATRRYIRARIGPGQSEGHQESRPDIPASYYYDPVFTGARMPAITARAMGRFNVVDTIRVRRRNFLHYRERLAGIPGIRPLFDTLAAGVCPLSYPVRIVDRDRINAELTARGVGTTPWWAGYHRSFDWGEFPEARALKESVLNLPAHQYLSEKQIDYAVNSLVELVRSAETPGKTTI